MIPTFPKFKRVTRNDQAAIFKHTNNFVPYSDFNFTSFWCWDTEKVRKISQLNGNLVVMMTDYGTGEPVLSFLGESKPTTTAKALIDYSKEMNLGTTLRYIPAASARNLSTKKLKLREDQGNFDFIFKLKNFIKLPGNRFKSKRRLLKSFLTEYPEAIFKQSNLCKESSKAIKAVIRTWEKNKKTDNKSYDLEHEQEAINRLMSMSPNDRLIFSVVFLKDKPIAFSIDEPLNKRYVISHFSKANKNYKGAGEFLNHQAARSFIKKGYSYWNWEQDLDESELRHSKMRYRPIKFLKKYTISER